MYAQHRLNMLSTCLLCRADRAFVSRRLEEVDGQLADARADKRETQRDRRMGETITSLKRLFPGMNIAAVIW